MKTDRQAVVWCGVLVMLSIAATMPVLEMGLNDDWSYTFIARNLSTTGRLQYFGWASAMVGVQAWCAALIISIFGFSFTAVRLTTSIFAVGCAVLLFKIARLSGLNRSFAMLAALSIVLSPVFTPLAASFMTDIPALFFLLACFYFGMRALDDGDEGSVVFWLLGVMVTGLLGGTVRQVVWGAPLSMIPVIAWVRRRDRRVVVVGAVLFAICAATVYFVFQWLGRQPFFESDPAPTTARQFLEMFADVKRFAALLRTCLLLMLPVLVIYLVGWWRKRRLQIVAPGALLLVGAWVVTEFVFGGAGFPHGNLVTRYGVLNQGIEAIGVKPIMLSRPLLAVLSLLTLTAATACALALLHNPVSTYDSSQQRDSARRVVLLAAPFTAGYLLILLYRARFGDLFDRYLLPLLPVVNLSLLWLYQRRIRDRVPMVAWVAVAVFGVYGTAATHDYISAARARLQAASALTDAGVPRTRITAGLEFDGWTELETSGHINNQLIAVPAGAFRYRPFRRYPGGLKYIFWELTPNVEPEYFVVYSRQPGFVDAAYPPVSYSTWLPPFTRTVYTQVVP